MDEQSVKAVRRYGSILAAAASICAVLYAVGLARRNYWTLAIPVTAITALTIGLSLWIGRLLMTTPAPLDEVPD